MHKNKRIIIVGVGTGGHLFPSLAVLEEIKKISPKTKVLFIGLKKGREKDIIQSRGIEVGFREISAGKLRRYFSWENFLDFFRFFGGIFQARKIIGEFRPQSIFSSGGFLALPIIIAAKIKKIPCIIHECDMVPGVSNKLSSYFASNITCSFEATCKKFPKQKSIFTGHPIRKEITKANAVRGLKFLGFKKKLPVLLVWGGSQGARRINQIISSSRKSLCNKMQIVHLGSSTDVNEERYSTFRFLEKELPDVLACADLVLGRSGASSIFESASLKKPQIMIPLPSSANHHQQKNAVEFLRQGAGLILDEKLLEPEVFIKIIEGIILSPEKLKNLSRNTKKFYKKDSSEKIAKLILTSI